jgi:hypothetical protein
MPAFRFGGPDASSVKTIDAIRSIHGFKTSAKFANQGHMEVLYFTQLYGWTRWESWAPEERLRDDPALRDEVAVANQRCSDPM